MKQRHIFSRLFGAVKSAHSVSPYSGSYDTIGELPVVDLEGLSDEEIDDKIGFYQDGLGSFEASEDGKYYAILEDPSNGDKCAVLEEDYENWLERYFQE